VPAYTPEPGPSRPPGHGLPGPPSRVDPPAVRHALSRSTEAARLRACTEKQLLGSRRLQQLDKQFGAPALSRIKQGTARIHDWECIGADVLLHPGRVLVPAAGGRTVHLPDLLDLDKLKDGSTFYMFTVTLVGALVIGEAAEIAGMSRADGTPARWGHPTLTGGAPARIAGELHYDPQAQAFYINNHSGRFNKGHHDRGRAQLEQVAELLLANGLEVGLRLHPGIQALAFQGVPATAG
jgi:hypothetical protein